MLEKIIDSNSLLLSYSAYTEDYALANISGKSEGLLVYGIDPKEALNIFNINLPSLESEYLMLNKDIILEWNRFEKEKNKKNREAIL